MLLNSVVESTLTGLSLRNYLFLNYNALQPTAKLSKCRVG